MDRDKGKRDDSNRDKNLPHHPNLIISLELVHNAGEGEREMGGGGGEVGERSKINEIVPTALTGEQQQVAPTFSHPTATGRG